MDNWLELVKVSICSSYLKQDRHYFSMEKRLCSYRDFNKLSFAFLAYGGNGNHGSKCKKNQQLTIRLFISSNSEWLTLQAPLHTVQTLAKEISVRTCDSFVPGQNAFKFFYCFCFLVIIFDLQARKATGQWHKVQK